MREKEEQAKINKELQNMLKELQSKSDAEKVIMLKKMVN